MKCERCGRENTEGARFCGACGAPLGGPTPPPYTPPPEVPRPGSSNTSSVLAVVLAVVVLGGLAMVAVLAAILFPVFSKARDRAKQAACISNLKQIAVATQMYVQDHQAYPPAASWQQALEPYTRTKDIFQCPGITEGGYAYNTAVSRRSARTVTSLANTPLVFDARHGELTTTGPNALAFRHGHMANVSFLDGHVQSLGREDRGRLIWTPSRSLHVLPEPGPPGPPGAPM